jgi:hypothetical protein
MAREPGLRTAKLSPEFGWPSITDRTEAIYTEVAAGARGNGEARP